MMVSWGLNRYFPDSVRDDYAAGQLDAQVRNSRPLSNRMWLTLELGGRCASGDERVVYMWRELRSDWTSVRLLVQSLRFAK
jgi:hypothetical protein